MYYISTIIARPCIIVRDIMIKKNINLILFNYISIIEYLSVRELTNLPIRELIDLSIRELTHLSKRELTESLSMSGTYRL